MKGSILCILGILGVLFVSTYDIILGKSVNDITGPKSISALFLCGVFIIMGVRFLRKKSNG